MMICIYTPVKQEESNNSFDNSIVPLKIGVYNNALVNNTNNPADAIWSNNNNKQYCLERERYERNLVNQ